MSKIKRLSNITLVAIGSTKIEETLRAIELCKKKFLFKDIVFFSDCSNPYQFKINKLKSIRDYDKFVVVKLPKLLQNKTSILTIHWDGFIVNPSAWTTEFLKYDYIGAPWPWINHFSGNGGFCLKSRKFLDLQNEFDFGIDDVNEPDDLFLSVSMRNRFMERGCKYGDSKIGYTFSTEYGGYFNHNSFGFHDLNVNPQFRPLLYSKK